MKELLEAWQQAVAEWRTAYLAWKEARDLLDARQKTLDAHVERARRAQEDFSREVLLAGGWTEEERRGG